MKQSVTILFMFCLYSLAAHSVMANEISVSDPWIREAPPGAKMLAAYMTIGNNSTHRILLEAASSPNFRMIEIHQVTMHEGIARMIKQSRLRIEAQSSIVLKPGSYHLMLMEPIQPLDADDKVKIQLRFDNGETIDVIAVVQKR